MHTRAERRHYKLKKKAQAKTVLQRYRLTEISDRLIGKHADNLAMCSCHMCGNPRKHWKQRTIQELKVSWE
jgi:hypothetical protein